MTLDACMQIPKELFNKLGEPNAAFSLEPQEFKAMVNSVRAVEKVLGEVNS